MKAHKTFYSTAEDKRTKQVFKVIAQDAASKEDAKHLLVKRPHGNVWMKIENLCPVF